MRAQRPVPIRRAGSAASILATLALAMPAVAQVAGPSSGTVGTVETIVGPGFCDGAASRAVASATVRALAVDGQGQLFVDTGPPSDGVVEKVDSGGRVSRLVTGVRTPAGGVGGPAEVGTEAPVASRLVADGQGGIILTTGSRIIQIDSSNGLTTIAGDPAGQPGDVGNRGSGDGGPATAARFVSARSIATDEAGNLYVADRIARGSLSFRVRLINRGTQPVTVYPRTPEQVSVQPGAIDTIAGAAGGYAPDDGGDARRVTPSGGPPAMAVAGGRLFIAVDSSAGDSAGRGSRVWVVNLSGAPTRARGVAVGPGAIGTMVVGGVREASSPTPTMVAGLETVPGIAADADGDVLIADELHDRVLRVDPGGTVATIAGVERREGAAGGFNGNDLSAAAAQLSRPFDVKLGPDGRVYISDQLNGQVRVIDGRGIIRLQRGGGMSATWSCAGDAAGGGPPEQPRPGAPAALAVDGRGTVFIALPARHEVKRLDGVSLMTTIAGGSEGDSRCATSSGGCAGDGGPAAKAALARPSAVALDQRGDLYILDSGPAPRVRYVNLGSDPVTVHGVTVAPMTIASVAGNGRSGLAGDGGPAVKAQLREIGSSVTRIEPLDVGPRNDVTSLPDARASGGDLPALGSLVVDGPGDLFIADPANRRIRMVDPRGTISTFAGEGAPAPRDRCCADPTGLALDASGDLFVADLGRSADGSGGTHPRVWAINRTQRAADLLGQTLPPGAVEPVVGSGDPGIAPEGGRAVDAPLLQPAGLVLDRRGDLFLAESGDVRKVDSSGTITTAIGTGLLGFNGDGLKGQLSQLSAPTGLALDPCGNLLVADLGGDRIRRLDLTPGCTPFAPRPVAEEPPGHLAGWAAVAVAVALVAGAAAAYAWFRRRPV